MRTITESVSGYLRAMSQVFFLRDEFFALGLLILLSFFDFRLFACAVPASLVGYVYSVRSTTPKLLRDSGLITINGFFFGLAMARWFEPSPEFYLALVFGALCLPLLTKAGFELMQHWRLSPFIMPYILAVWVVCLCAHSLPALAVHPLPNPIAPTRHPLWGVPVSMAELLFVADPFFGLGILILLVISSPRRGLFFLLGTALAWGALQVLSPEAANWDHYFLSSSAGLVGLGLASSQERIGAFTILLFCVLSSFIALASAELLKETSLPILSLPYVVTFWLALLSRSPRVSLSWSQVRK